MKAKQITISKQAASEQFATDLGEFFGSIPGMKEVFSKGPLNKTTSTTPNCTECEAQSNGALMKLQSVLHRIDTITTLVEDLIQTQAATAPRQRVLALLAEIGNLVDDGRDEIAFSI
jgi:hypothetical protein